jgi:hypothetical protein
MSLMVGRLVATFDFALDVIAPFFGTGSVTGSGTIAPTRAACQRATELNRLEHVRSFTPEALGKGPVPLLASRCLVPAKKYSVEQIVAQLREAEKLLD